MYLYRVCLPPEVNPAWEDLPMPGGNNTFTGFWTPHIQCAKDILSARKRACIVEFGAGTYAQLYRIRRDEVVIGNVPEGAKTGHDDDYDKDEVFVTKVLSNPECVKGE